MPIADHVSQIRDQGLQSAAVASLGRKCLGNEQNDTSHHYSARDRQDPEDPAPPDGAEKCAADQWRDHGSDTADDHHDAEELRCVVATRSVGNTSAGKNDGSASTQALDESCTDEKLDVRRHRACRAAQCRDDCRGQQYSSPAKSVGDRTDDQLADSEACHEGGQRELNAGRSSVECIRHQR